MFEKNAFMCTLNKDLGDYLLIWNIQKYTENISFLIWKNNSKILLINFFYFILLCKDMLKNISQNYVNLKSFKIYLKFCINDNLKNYKF